MYSNSGVVNGNGVVNGIPVPAFSGLLDSLSNIVVAYGVRRLRSGYTGSLLRMRRSSDNAESDFGYTSNGDIDAAAITAWLGGASGFIVTWYDQSGNGRNLAQATADNQPLYVASDPNGRPAVAFDGTNDNLRTTFSSVALPQHVFTILKVPTGISGRHLFDGGATNTMGLYQNSGTAANDVRLFTGPLSDVLIALGTASYSMGTFLFRTTGGNSYLRKNGVTTNNTFGQGNALTGVTLGTRGDGTTSFSIVRYAEFILFNAIQTELAVETNMRAYYGV